MLSQKKGTQCYTPYKTIKNYIYTQRTPIIIVVGEEDWVVFYVHFKNKKNFLNLWIF